MSTYSLFSRTGLTRLRSWLWLGLVLLAGCSAHSTKPDLERLYADMPYDPRQPPVVIIHGLMGSTLVDADTGKEYWPGSLGAMAFSDYRELDRLDDHKNPYAPRLVPRALFTGIAGVDFYARLIDSLEKIGQFKRGEPGTAATEGERRYYLMLYDWRRDNLEAVRQLHALIEQIRRDYGNPEQRVDIIAHSNGGLIANYYLRYGPADVLNDTTLTPWAEGPLRVRRLVRMGTPQLGSATSLERLLVGVRIALRTVPVEVLATFATPFESLPSTRTDTVIDSFGQPVSLDLFDPQVWRKRAWSVYAPEVIERVVASAATREQGASQVADLHALFERHLRRAGQFQRALAKPLPAGGVREAVFGGDCNRTQARAVIENRDGREVLAFSPGEITHKVDGINYDWLLFEPGDGLVTRRSQVGRLDSSGDPAQMFFLCEDHGRLTGNPYFQNNLLFFLLGR